MYVVSATVSEAAPPSVPESLDFGLPCAFNGCAGFVHRAGGSTGVVLCAPWGFEDLTMRKSWRLLAEAIAKAGYPCLRFDYPGTGNSLGDAIDVTSTDAWVEAIGRGADFLRRATGVRRFVFLGQSLGATLAVEAARRRSDVVGLQLIMPIAKGRAYVRELAATATIVADKIGITPELAPGEGISVLGFALSPAMIESLRSFDLTRLPSLNVSRVAIFDQPDRKSGAEVVEHLRKLGADVAAHAIAPFHIMVSDATAIQPLPVSAEMVIASLGAMQPVGQETPLTPHPLQTALVAPSFREDPIRFGPHRRLFGIVTRPTRERDDGLIYILLNRGLNANIGWRRASVDQARGLAAAGFTSLRIDVAGLGESGDEPGRPANLIYSDLLVPDVRAAIDHVAAKGYQRIALVGVCSGAYMALNVAHADPRVTDVVAVNPQRFVWNPAESHDDVIRFGLRSMNDYVGDIKGFALRKLFMRRHRIVPAMRFLAKRHMKRVMTRVPVRWRSVILRNSMAGRVHRFFEAMHANGTRISLVFSHGDPGLVELDNYFGAGGRDLPFSNVDVSILADADHNLTTTRATNAMLDLMIAATAAGRPGASLRPPRRAPEPRRAVCAT